jgi:hypothetical protein
MYITGGAGSRYAIDFSSEHSPHLHGCGRRTGFATDSALEVAQLPMLPPEPAPAAGLVKAVYYTENESGVQVHL